MRSKNENSQTKEDLLRELSQNLDMDLADNDKESNTKPNNSYGIKDSLSAIPEASIEISCIEPLKIQKDKFDRNEDSTILNIFGDEDENDNLVSFYGPGGDLQEIVNNIDLNKSEPIGFLAVVTFYKVNNEHLSKLTQSINQKDLLTCKRIMDKIEFDEKMVTKINDLKYLLIKSKDISNEDSNEILTKKEYSDDLFSWRDMLPGDDSFYRSVMFSYLEYLILNNDFENYKTFLYDLSLNISDKYFSKILNYYQIDITKVKISLALIYYAMNAGSSDNYIEKAIHLFMKTYNMDQNFDLLLILNLKFVIYKYLKLNEKRMYSKEIKIKIGEFLPEEFTKKGKYNFKEFYENNLLPLSKRVDGIAISVIPFIFKRNLYIYSFENKKIINKYYFADSKENRESFPFRLIILNGSYNIIYDRTYYSQFLKMFSLYSNIPKSSVNNHINERNENKENRDILKNESFLRNKPLNNLKEKNNLNTIKNNNNLVDKKMVNNLNKNSNSTSNNNNITDINQNIYKKMNSQTINGNHRNISEALNNHNKSNNNFQLYNTINNQANNLPANNNPNLNQNQQMINNIQNNNNNEIPNVFKDMNNQSNLNINNTNKKNFSNMKSTNNDDISNINNNISNILLNNNNNINNSQNNINTNINGNINSNINNNIIKNMNINMNNNMNNNTNNNINNNINDMMNNYGNNLINSNGNLINNLNIDNSQAQININVRANTVIESNEGYSSTQFEGSNINIHNFINNQTYAGNISNISNILSQNMGRECPLCKKPNKDNFYCENCLLQHMLPYIKNNYIHFIKDNIDCLNQQKDMENFNMFLSNLSIVFPNGTTKSFSECYYLISDQNKNYFNEQMNQFKTSICLGCFNIVTKDKNEFLDNLYFRLPCNCVFCNSNCLNRFLSTIPIKNMKSFNCICGVKYDYIQLKYFLYFSISFNLTKLKKEIMRYMNEIIKTKCCKCKKSIERLNKEKININAKELMDQEAERIFGIHKFNHLICDKCEKNIEMIKNKFYCNLCISEHSIVKPIEYKIIQNNDTCSIF